MGKDLKGRELGKCLSQRKDGRYQARFTNRYGQRIEYKDKNFNNVKEWLKEERAKNDLRINAKFCSDSLDIWYQRWKKMTYIDLTVSTQRIYDNAYRIMIAPELKDFKISDINEFKLRQFFQDLKNYYEDATIHIAKNVMTQIMQCCKEAGYISYNPAKEIKLIPKALPDDGQPPEPKSSAMSLEEQMCLFNYLNGHFYYNLFVFALNTGLRYGELASLDVDSIDFENNIVLVRRSLKYEKINGEYKLFFGKTKTKSSVRNVPLNKYAINAAKKQIELKHIIEQSKLAKKDLPEQFRNLLFVTQFNTPVGNGTLNAVLRRACEDINFQRKKEDYIKSVSMHKLRHTFATRCYETGIPMKIISKYLGHKDVMTTERIYIHLLLDFVNIHSDKLNEIFDESDFKNDSPCFQISDGKENGVKLESA